MDFGFVLFRYFPFGGLQRDMLALARATHERGHAVTIYTRDWRGDRPSDIAVETLAVGGLSNHARDRQLARRFAGFRARHDRIVGFNKMPGLDFYYAADGCLAAQLAGRAKRRLPRYRARLAMEAAVFERASTTRVLSISPPQKALYQQHYGTDPARFHDLPPGIRHDRVAPTDYGQQRRAQRQRWQIDDDCPLLLFVGSGFRTKGLDRAIMALAHQANAKARLVVIGADKARPYRQQARRLGVAERVQFLGARDDISAWLWAADLLLHPAYAENTGTVLLEAAVAGLPVLTTDACGYAPWIEQARMGTVVAGEELHGDALADAVNTIVAQPREPWVERGRAFAERAPIFSLVERAVDCITGEENRP